METLKELTEPGQSLGYEGAGLQNFVRQQQELERAERQSARDAKRAEIENACEQKGVKAIIKYRGREKEDA